MSVLVPTVVPLTTTDAPMTGTPLTSLTFPVTATGFSVDGALDVLAEQNSGSWLPW